MGEKRDKVQELKKEMQQLENDKLGKVQMVQKDVQQLEKEKQQLEKRLRRKPEEIVEKACAGPSQTRQCYGLSRKEGVNSWETCRTECRKDASCIVWQYSASCYVGTDDDCKGDFWGHGGKVASRGLCSEALTVFGPD